MRLFFDTFSFSFFSFFKIILTPPPLVFGYFLYFHYFNKLLYILLYLYLAFMFLFSNTYKVLFAMYIMITIIYRILARIYRPFNLEHITFIIHIEPFIHSNTWFLSFLTIFKTPMVLGGGTGSYLWSLFRTHFSTFSYFSFISIILYLFL